MTKKATIVVDMQCYKEIRTFLISNLMDWDAIIGHTMWYHLTTGMNVNHIKVSIQPRGKMRYDLNMLYRVTGTPVMQAAATFIEWYDSQHDTPISYDSSSHACETETDADTTNSSASDSKDEPALSHHTADNDSQGRQEEQAYQMLDGTPTLPPCLDCDWAEDMVPEAQPH